MDAAQLSQYGNQISLYGQAAGGIAHLMYGLQARQAAEYQAAQLRINAGQEQAAAQRDAYFADQNTQAINSHALAVAAASGGGASDPTVIRIIAQNAAMGAYQKSVALYQGDERARLMKMQADTAEYEGEVKQLNSTLESVGQFAQAGGSYMAGQARGASLYQRYAGSGPKAG